MLNDRVENTEGKIIEFRFNYADIMFLMEY